MTQATDTTVDRPTWVDLATSDAEAARDFYGKVFGWRIEVDPDPQYGGYALAKLDGQDAAGIGPVQSPGQSTTWTLYIGTDDVDRRSQRVQAADGTVVAPPFDVGDQGRMGTFRDPSGATFSAWQGTRMGGFQTNASNGYGWSELTSNDIEKALPFCGEVFGWGTRRSRAYPGGRFAIVTDPQGAAFGLLEQERG
jgi:predicted enzyme related to lactoylglutathione lyase